jgi:hypothetical protein
MHKLLLLVLALAVPALSFAQDSDTQELSRYVLTEAALSKYMNAVERLRPVAEQISSCGDEESAESISGVAAHIDRSPAARSAIQSAGLTTREYVVFTFAMFQTGLAAWAMEQPGGKLPPGVSKANVDFYQAHRAKIDAMQPLDDGCGASAEEGEEEVPEEG